MKTKNWNIASILVGSLLVMFGVAFQNEMALASTTSPYWERYSNGTLFYNNGWVGIGTSTPGTSLHIANDNVSSGGITIGSGAADGGNLRLRSNVNHWNLDNSSGSLRFFTETGYGSGGILRALMDGNGNFGLGTASPGAKLDVSGDIRGSGNIIASGSNSWIFHSPDDGRTTLHIAPGVNSGAWEWGKQAVFYNNGNMSLAGKLGINTANPDRSLEVNGGMMVTTGLPSCAANGPGYAFRTDTCYDSGMFSTGDGDVRLYSNGNKRIHLSNNGDVCIGNCGTN